MPVALLQSALPLLAEFKLETLLPAAGVMLIIMAMMSIMRKRRRFNAAHPQLTPQEQLERNKQLRGMQGDLEELMVEIEQFAKRLGSQLDAKRIELERLLKQAEQKANELRELRGEDVSAGSTTETASPAPAPADPSDNISATAAPATAESAAATKTESESHDPVAKAVYRLKAQSMQPLEIAQKIGKQVGEVGTMLALRG